MMLVDPGRRSHLKPHKHMHMCLCLNMLSSLTIADLQKSMSGIGLNDQCINIFNYIKTKSQV